MTAAVSKAVKLELPGSESISNVAGGGMPRFFRGRVMVRSVSFDWPVVNSRFERGSCVVARSLSGRKSRSAKAVAELCQPSAADPTIMLWFMLRWNTSIARRRIGYQCE
ncbi:hypothetical protein [Bradyrhizobium sp. CCGUVB14]|uniref:hypothetical protein n=1 Tax=Bradyrhizobium sp. CCGUVB14 TaxID=2949628 RepID=UPI0020B3553D|nr:hypothetical protein [Bradyrhizobium sp. CCGUVB14]MCP3447214.1 hypothetical protein [Bradyrhizobium sp. CCGUVB14]